MEKSEGIVKSFINLLIDPIKAGIKFERDLKEVSEMLNKLYYKGEKPMNKTCSNCYDGVFVDNETIKCALPGITGHGNSCGYWKPKEKSMSRMEKLEQILKDVQDEIKEIKEQDSTLEAIRNTYYKCCESIRPDWEVDFVNALEKEVRELKSEITNLKIINFRK